MRHGGVVIHVRHYRRARHVRTHVCSVRAEPARAPGGSVGEWTGVSEQGGSWGLSAWGHGTACSATWGHEAVCGPSGEAGRVGVGSSAWGARLAAVGSWGYPVRSEWPRGIGRWREIMVTLYTPRAGSRHT